MLTWSYNRATLLYLPAELPVGKLNDYRLAAQGFLLFAFLLHFTRLFLLFLHLLQPFLPFGLGLRLLAVLFYFGQDLIVIDNVILYNKLEDQCDDIGHRVIPGKRRRQPVEDKQQENRENIRHVLHHRIALVR